MDRTDPPWVESPVHWAWLLEQARRQLGFARRAPHPDGGAWYLDDRGEPDPGQPVQTFVTARMVHVYSLGHLAGVPGCRQVAERCLAGLTGPLRDDEHGGWLASRGPGEQRDDTKAAYPHAFVVFAAASATVAGLPGAAALLEEALGALDRFWEDEPGMHRDRADRTWQQPGHYRGVNANMHAVEALLGAADATGQDRWRQRALRICRNVIGWAADHEWRIPEHFTPGWQPLLEHHRDQPDHPFEPYGATVGHGLEWARLLLHAEAAVTVSSPAEADGLLLAARSLFERAVTDGWSVDGAPGFVYTTDWSGAPVVRTRMHWVAAEAIAAAAALHRRTGDRRYEEWYRAFWDYAATFLVTDDGSWHHELDPQNAPAASVWPGRPDLYHSLHAVLLPLLPLAPTAPTALARGALAERC